MCKQILHDVPQGPPLTLCSSLAITCLAFIGSSSYTGYWALEYKSLPGCLEVINSQLRVLFGPTSAEIEKNKKKKPTARRLQEAAILHQMILHQTFLHLGTDRDMAGWHGSTGHVPRIHCWCFRTIQQTVPQFAGLARDPWVLFICSAGLIDSVFLHPCSQHTTNILVMPTCTE